MVRPMSILFHAFSRLSLSPRNPLINEFNREIDRETPNATDIYIAGSALIRPYHNDANVRTVYQEGIRRIKEREPFTALELCRVPLDMTLHNGFYFEKFLISTILDICPKYIAENPSIEAYDDAIYYLDQAAAHYSDHPKLANEALNLAFDLINAMGRDNPARAASIAKLRFPNETYMFADDIAQEMRRMPQAVPA